MSDTSLCKWRGYWRGKSDGFALVAKKYAKFWLRANIHHPLKSILYINKLINFGSEIYKNLFHDVFSLATSIIFKNILRINM